MTFKEFLKDNIVCLDGGTGTLLQQCGLALGEKPESWNITHPEIVIKIQSDYFSAGSNVVSANTFGANCLKFPGNELEEIIKAALENTLEARRISKGEQEKFVAFDMGPLGRLLKPYGDADFEETVEIFAKSVRLAEKYGAEIIFIQTMNDSYETKAALLAAKENCNLPVLVSNAYDEDCKLMTGASPLAMISLLEGMGADAIGINCSFGPKILAPVIEEYLKYSSLPVILKPNAGLPEVREGKTVFNLRPEEFSTDVAEFVFKGVRLAGGCCGTTPEYIFHLKKKIADAKPRKIKNKGLTVISSYADAVVFGKKPILIGERINPTGKKRFKEALIENDIDYILGEGVTQQEKGAEVLDVNVGIPDIDEKEMLKSTVTSLQAIIPLPLQIDTSDVKAMEEALRLYNGKALINSVNGKAESMQTVFPLQKKYGGVIIALTLDENGIPQTAEGRVEIAEKILKTAEKYGIDKKDIIFDTLAMTVSADSGAGKTTLAALEEIKNKLGCHTSLGVSNVSFGLPERDRLNSAFFISALEKGLSVAIMNPNSVEMMSAYYSFCALHGLDENFERYISFAENNKLQAVSSSATEAKSEDYGSKIKEAIIKGLKERAGSLCEELLKTEAPLDIVQNEIIPALDIVGKSFEEKRVYLPQLLMSAEAAGKAFEKIKLTLPKAEKTENAVVIATVKGDIHDIGKNIVKLLLENYGFDVCDLGKDVPAEKILSAVKERNARLCGLSALMTTTVSSMQDTISLLRREAPNCKVVVGGAVLNEDYAKKIGADKYSKDAMETVRYAEEIFK